MSRSYISSPLVFCLAVAGQLYFILLVSFRSHNLYKIYGDDNRQKKNEENKPAINNAMSAETCTNNAELHAQGTLNSSFNKYKDVRGLHTVVMCANLSNFQI
jgi:hypothetical protein